MDANEIENEIEPEIEMDIIDDALDKLLDEFIPEDVSEEEFDSKANIFMAVYADLVDDGLIEEAPDEASGDELKKNWVESSIPVLRQHLQGEIDADSSLA